MNRWARIQVAIAGAGALLFVVTGLLGFRLGGDRSRFVVHTQLGLLAVLLILLGLVWCVVYVGLSQRLLGHRTGWGQEELARTARSVRWVVPCALVAAVASVAHFLIAGRTLLGQGPPSLHLWSALATGALLVVALGVAARGLARHQRLVDDRKAAARVLDSAGS